MKVFAASVAGLVVATAFPGIASAQQNLSGGDPVAGRAFALQVCTPCHVVAEDQIAPRRLATAPPFAAIANTRAMTATALHAYLATPHPTMPNLILMPQESDDVIAYILSLKRS